MLHIEVVSTSSVFYSFFIGFFGYNVEGIRIIPLFNTCPTPPGFFQSLWLAFALDPPPGPWTPYQGPGTGEFFRPTLWLKSCKNMTQSGFFFYLFMDVFPNWSILSKLEILHFCNKVQKKNWFLGKNLVRKKLLGFWPTPPPPPGVGVTEWIFLSKWVVLKFWKWPPPPSG